MQTRKDVGLAEGEGAVQATHGNLVGPAAKRGGKKHA